GLDHQRPQQFNHRLRLHYGLLSVVHLHSAHQGARRGDVHPDGHQQDGCVPVSFRDCNDLGGSGGFTLEYHHHVAAERNVECPVQHEHPDQRREAAAHLGRHQRLAAPGDGAAICGQRPGNDHGSAYHHDGYLHLHGHRHRFQHPHAADGESAVEHCDECLARDHHHRGIAERCG